MSRFTRTGLIFFSLLFLLSGFGAAEIQMGEQGRKAWNSAEILSLADQLVDQLSNARREVRMEAGLKNASTRADRAITQFNEKLRMLEKSASQYAGRVKSGAGYEKTRGIARKVGVQLRDLEVLGRRLVFSKPTADTLVAAQRTLNQLSPYYGRVPLYPEPGVADAPGS